MTKGVPPQAGSGHSPKGGAASSTASPAQPSVPNAMGVRRGFDLISAHIAYIEGENLRLNELLTTYYVNALRGDGESLLAFIKDQGHEVHRDRKSLTTAIADFQASAETPKPSRGTDHG